MIDPLINNRPVSYTHLDVYKRQGQETLDKIDVGSQVSRWAVVLKKKKKKHLLLKHESIVRFVNAELVQWLRHQQRTNDQRMPTDVLRAQVYKSIKSGRPRIRWLDDVMEHLRRMM